jgi:hypothetical protein
MIHLLKRMAKERQVRQQIERDLRMREARRRYDKFIVSEERRSERLYKLKAEAHLVGSHLLLTKLTQIIGQTEASIKLWKERMVYFEMMQEMMSQAQACASFAEAFHTMAQSIISAANPADLARIQSDMQRSMLFAGQLNEMTDQLVEMMDGELDSRDAARTLEMAPVLDRLGDKAESTQSALDREIATLRLEIASAKQ